MAVGNIYDYLYYPTKLSNRAVTNCVSVGSIYDIDKIVKVTVPCRPVQNMVIYYIMIVTLTRWLRPIMV